MASVEVAGTIKDIPPGTMKRVEVGGKAVLLVNLDGTILAVAGECTHAGAPLEEEGRFVWISTRVRGRAV